MPIRFIPNQPLKLQPFYQPTFCKTNDPYCYLHQPGDPLRMQWRQIPSGITPAQCSPFFNASGTELIINGTFTGGAASWVLARATYGSDQVCFDGDIMGGTLTQTISTPPANGSLCQLTFTVSGITTGALQVFLGGTLGFDISVDGTYTVNIVKGSLNDDLVFDGDSGFDGCIDSVSLQQLFPCWVYDNDSFFVSFNSQTFGNKITHIPGTATTFTVDDMLISGNFYQASIRVQGRTTGSVQMFAGDQDLTSTPITQNGTFTQYLTADETGVAVGDPVDFFFVMSDDFDGTIESVFVFELRTDFIVTLIDTDGTPVADLSNRVLYFLDYCTLSFNGLQAITDFNGDPIEYGCYKISVSEVGYNGNYIEGGDFSIDDPNPYWNEVNYFVGGIYGGQANAVSTGLGVFDSTIYQPNSLGLEEDVWYIALFKYKANFVDPGTTVEMKVGGTSAIIVNDVLTTWQNAVSQPFKILSALVTSDVIVTMADDTVGNTVSIDDVQIYQMNQYTTNCINYQAEHPGTYRILGQGNPHAGSYGLGFLFQARTITTFFLIQRLELGFRTPHYPINFNDGEYSTGRHFKSFSSSGKVYEVLFSPVGEIEHDAIAATIQCPIFLIEGIIPMIGPGIDENRYHCITENYSPNWDDKGENLRADSTIQVQHIEDIIKISNI